MRLRSRFSEKRRLSAERDAPDALQFVLSDIISRRAILGWATKGQTDVGVHLYAEGREVTVFAAITTTRI